MKKRGIPMHKLITILATPLLLVEIVALAFVQAVLDEDADI